MLVFTGDTCPFQQIQNTTHLRQSQILRRSHMVQSDTWQLSRVLERLLAGTRGIRIGLTHPRRWYRERQTIGSDRSQSGTPLFHSGMAGATHQFKKLSPELYQRIPTPAKGADRDPAYVRFELTRLVREERNTDGQMVVPQDTTHRRSPC